MAISGLSQMADYLGDLSRNYFSFWSENSEKVCEDEEDIRGKIVIVTGSNIGIGKQTAFQLAKRGAVVIMAVRNLGKGQAALHELRKRITGDSQVSIELMKLDLGELQSVRDFVAQFQRKYDHLDILINNAGFIDINPEVQKTKDGFEEHIGVNHLGTFLLTRLLLPFLQKAPTTPGRIVSVSSSTFAIAPLNFMDDLMMEKGCRTGNGGREQYNISKLCNAICMMKLANDSSKVGQVKIYQLCPGLVKKDEFRTEMSLLKKIQINLALGAIGLTPHQASETVVYCAVAKSIAETEGSGKAEMYRFKKPWTTGTDILKGYLVEPNLEIAQKLYKLSEELVGL